MSGCPDDNTLVLLGEGALSDFARAQVESHLDDCVVCSELLTELAVHQASGGASSRYRRLRPLAAGAMGIVWEGEDVALGRRVALKTVRPGAAGDQRGERLLREARALARLRHPNVLAVYAIDETANGLQLAMELVSGQTARGWSEAPRTPEQVLTLWRQVGAGLVAVHRAGLVHRDLKPDNVLVSDDGRVLVADFGLAARAPESVDPQLTVTGQILGTPAYMAPEQLAGDEVTAASDQFALCACIWEALEGSRPFQGASVAALAVAIANHKPTARMGPAAVMRVLARGLAPAPADRWPDVEALLEALRAEGTVQSSGRVRTGVIGVALAAATAVGAAWLFAGSADSAHELAVASSGRRNDAAPDARASVAPSEPTALLERAGPSTQGPKLEQPAKSDRPKRAVLQPKSADPGTGSVGSARSAAAGWSARSVTGTIDYAIVQLRTRDGSGCLETLARLERSLAGDVARVPRVVGNPKQRATLLAQCTMLAGDCAGGRGLLQAQLATEGKPQAWIDQRVDHWDLRLCPVASSPRARWTPRALHALAAASGDSEMCAQVLAELDRTELTFTGDQEARYLWGRLRCLNTVGRCEELRALHPRAMLATGLLEEASSPEAQAAQRRDLLARFPDCYQP